VRERRANGRAGVARAVDPPSSAVGPLRPEQRRPLHSRDHSTGTGTGTGTAAADYMTPDDLPELFAFLMTNGYTVDTGLTKLAAKHQSSAAGALVCIISTTATQ